jgi:RNA polymerase sigma-54 factor
LNSALRKNLKKTLPLRRGQEEEVVEGANDADDDEVFEDKDQEEFTLDDYMEDDDIPDYRLQVNNTEQGR